MSRPRKNTASKASTKFFHRSNNGQVHMPTGNIMGTNGYSNAHAGVASTQPDKDYQSFFTDLQEQLTHKFETDLESAMAQAVGKFGSIINETKVKNSSETARAPHEFQVNFPPSIHQPYSHATPDHFETSRPFTPKSYAPNQAFSVKNDISFNNPHNPFNSSQMPVPPQVINPQTSTSPTYTSPTYTSPTAPLSMSSSTSNPTFAHTPPSQVPTTQPPSSTAVLNSNDQGLKDKITFLEKELLAAYQRESQLRQDIEKLQTQVTQERVGISQEIAEIKKEVNKSGAPHGEENKFASLSSQLSQVMQSMNTIMTEEPSTPATPFPSTSAPIATPSPVVTPTATTQPTPASAQPTAQTTPAPNSRKKKLIIIGSVIGGTLLVLAALAWYLMRGGQAQVDANLVNDYLNQTAPASPDKQSDASATSPPSTDSPTPAVQGVSTSAAPDTKYEASFADVDYSKTQWDTHKNPQLGIQFDYPINVTNVIRTDTSVTVLRKTGYIFKLQYIESALEVDEYWKQIKARNLNYKVQPTKFRDQSALFLELEDISDYPGDRYLVKKDNVIYDIWYATPSKNVNSDDAKRVDIILNSFKFL